MAIQLWDPFTESVSLRDAVNSLFQENFLRPTNLWARDGASVLPVDICESQNEFVIKASLPGVHPDNVQISVQGGMLTIRGEIQAEDEKNGGTWRIRERRLGLFQRSFTLGTPVDADQAEARYENGILTLKIPKAEDAKPRQIKVGWAAPSQSRVGQTHSNN
jgi:HSP20 family protein